MRFATVWACVVLILSAVAAACMRPQLDDRAIQWSTAIVAARITSIGPEIKLGELQERRGALGALGVSTTSYFYRDYQFQVTRVLDGTLKKGESFPVIRLFSRADPRAEQGIGGCAQHLSPAGVGKDFVLLVRPLFQFKVLVPNGIDSPDVKGGMWVVHLEPLNAIDAAALTELEARIASVRAAERQSTPEQVEHLIAQIRSAPSDARAGPSVRALERFGPSIIPAIQQAATRQTIPQVQNRLLQVVSDLTPPEPITQIQPQQPSSDQRQ